MTDVLIFTFNILGIIGLLGAILISALYLTEAYKQSLGIFCCVLFIPFYIIYFSLIKSEKSVSSRRLLLISIGLIALPLIAEPFLGTFIG
jgi:hypothetical protein